MGCDIHTMAEVRYAERRYDADLEKVVTEEPRWRAVTQKIFPSAYFNEEEAIDPFAEYGNFPYSSEPYQGRNYWLFSILADVRNERRTANIFDPSMRYEERDSLAPIALPRGVPDDASEEWRAYVEEWGPDLHSTSYFTLTELLAAVEAGAFRQVFTCRGYVAANDFRLLLSTGTPPKSWASYASSGIQRDQWDAMTTEEQNAFSGYIAAEWRETTEGALTSFVEGTIPELLKLAPRIGERDREAWRAGLPDERPRDTDAVRLVFGFDN